MRVDGSVECANPTMPIKKRKTSRGGVLRSSSGERRCGAQYGSSLYSLTPPRPPPPAPLHLFLTRAAADRYTRTGKGAEGGKVALSARARSCQ